MSTANWVVEALQSNSSVKLKQERPGKYRGNSPLRSGSDSGGFTLTIDNDGEHGAWSDHVSNEHGSLYDLAKRLNIATPNGNSATKPIDKSGLDKAPDEPPTLPAKKSRGFASLDEYAAYQGVPVDVFKKAGCTVIQHKNAPHIVFPCSDGINRLRRMDSKAWYPQKTGATPQLYGWKRALQLRTQIGTNDPLVLTNGQPSVIVAQHYGIAAFCLTDGENKPIPDEQLLTIQRELDKGITLYIAKDNDIAGEQGTKAVLAQLWQYGTQIKTIRFKGDKGYDLANHCKKHGEASLEEIKQFETTITINPAEETVKDLTRQVGQLTNLLRQKEGDEAINTQLHILNKKVERLQSTHASIEVVENAIQEPYDLFNERFKNPRAITGFKSGHKQLDYAIGGFNKRRVHRLLASTSAGKSLLMAVWAYSFGTQAPGMIVSFESGSMEFVFRMVAAETRFPFGDIMKAGQLIERDGKFDFQRFNSNQADSVRRSFGNLSGWHRMKRFIFPKRAPATPLALYTFAEKCKKQFGIEWAIVDSLNNMSAPGSGQQESMAMAAINSESMAVDFDLAIIDTVQGGRNTKDRNDKRLGISDGKWSSEIEEKAHVHMSLYNHWVHVLRGDIVYKDDDEMLKDEADYPRNTAEITINKARGSGMVGRKVVLSYVGGAGFYNYDK